MKTKTRKPKFTKLRASFKKYKRKSMSFFNRRRSFRRQRFSRPRFNRGGGYRKPYRVRFGLRSVLRSPILILAALIGGALFLFKDQVRPLWEKITNHNSTN